MDDLRENQQLPTREAVARQFTDKTSEEQQELLARAMQQWQSENTRLYFLVKDSVVISGDWEALDRETIKESGGHGTQLLVRGFWALRYVPSITYQWSEAWRMSPEPTQSPRGRLRLW